MVIMGLGSSKPLLLYYSSVYISIPSPEIEVISMSSLILVMKISNSKSE